jgi:hypothetical protein
MRRCCGMGYTLGRAVLLRLCRRTDGLADFVTHRRGGIGCGARRRVIGGAGPELLSGIPIRHAFSWPLR